MPDDVMGALLSDELSEALDFVLLLAYSRGWTDAYDALRDAEPPLAIADATLAGRIEQAAARWHARLARRTTIEPIPPTVPPWLQAEIERRNAP